MSKTIWKYPLKVIDAQTISIPRGYQLLSAQNQNEVPCLWALVDPDEPKDNIVIEIFGTGHDINTSIVERKYISTFQMKGGVLVFHAFERLPVF